MAVKISEIVNIVCEREGITPSHLKGEIKFRPLIPLRYEVWWAARELGHTFPRIAREFGVTHSAVMYGVHRFEDALCKAANTAVQKRIIEQYTTRDCPPAK
jgi:chromosomal replication initiation ATPase DnaA